MGLLESAYDDAVCDLSCTLCCNGLYAYRVALSAPGGVPHQRAPTHQLPAAGADCTHVLLAAVFGLPTLLIEGNDVDACYDTALWNTFLANYSESSGNSRDIKEGRRFLRGDVELIRSDMCGWRIAAKRAFMGASIEATKVTLQVRCVGSA